MRLLEGLAAAVPQGKALVWILSGMLATFGAGFGLAFGVGDTAASIKLVPEILLTVEEHTQRIDVVELRLNSADADRERIVCLVRLTATNEILTPFEVDRECP